MLELIIALIAAGLSWVTVSKMFGPVIAIVVAVIILLAGVMNLGLGLVLLIIAGIGAWVFR